MKRFMMLALALSLALGIAAGHELAAAQLDSEFQLDKAREAAAGWLALLDGGDYSSSWSQSDKLFQRAIVQQSWPDAATKLRGELGRLVSRKFSGRQYSERLPGVPNGQYVLITFRSDFENRKEVEETLTVAFAGRQGWRVAGYRIK